MTYDPEHHKILQRRHLYGLEKNQVDYIIESQGGTCPICTVRPATHVDHDHGTEEVRGVLCNHCNRGIGLLGDDPDTLLRAIQYLGAEPLNLPAPVRVVKPSGARHVCGVTNSCPGEDELRRMYVEEWSRVADIMAELGCSAPSFYSYLKSHGIDKRGRSRTAPPKIADRNGVKNPRLLQIGTRLVIPRLS